MATLTNVISNSTGNVGIGTTIPAYKLEVNGTTFLRGNLNAGKTANINTTTAVNGTGGGNREFVTFTGASATGFTGTDNADQGYGYFAVTIVSGRSYEVSATMVVTNGTTLDWVTSTVLSSPTVPVQMIQLVPVSNTTYSFVATGDATYFGVGFNRTSGTMTAVVSNFSLKEVGSVLVTSNSNVGIGTTVPKAKINIASPSGTVGALSDSNLFLLFNNATAQSAVGFNHGKIGWTGYNRTVLSAYIESGIDAGTFDDHGYIAFGNSNASATATVERMRIAQDGSVLIGVTGAYNSSRLLQVKDGLLIGNSFYTFASIDTSGTADLILSSNAGPANLGSNSNIIFKLGTSAGGGPEERMRIVSNGNVGIGFTAPAANLHVFGPTMIVGDSNTTQNVRQTIVGSTTGNASTTAKKIFVCGHTSTGTINVTAIITSVSTASATATFSFANAFGNNVTPNRLSYISLNSTITSIDCSYNNSGYQMEIAVTYTGATAPTLYFTAEGMGSGIWTL